MRINPERDLSDSDTTSQIWAHHKAAGHTVEKVRELTYLHLDLPRAPV